MKRQWNGHVPSGAFRAARVTVGLAAIALGLCAGCPVVDDLPAPGRVVQRQDPELGRTYHLYLPSYYDATRSWPMVVTCHGTVPFDSAPAQLDTWKGLAEQKGFLVVAPELAGTSGLAPSAAEQIELQRQDEQTILSATRAVRASFSIDERRIFLTSWSAGGFAALFTGLRHPETFRALSIYQGNFQPEYVQPCVPFLDPYQPIQLVYGAMDPIDNAQGAIRWLRAHDLEPDVLVRTGSHKRDARPAFEFFEKVVRERPWVRVIVRDDPADAMRVRLSVQTSFEPVKVMWDLGDGQGSTDAVTTHRYEKAGTYLLRVAAWMNEKRYYTRRVNLQIPRVRIGVQPAASTPSP